MLRPLTLALLLVAISCPLGAQNLMPSLSNWTLINPVVNGTPQYQFTRLPSEISWCTGPGANPNLLAGAEVSFTVPVAGQYLLDQRAWSAGTGTTTMNVSIGATSFTTNEGQQSIFSRVVTLAAGSNTMRVLATGSSFGCLDVNHLPPVMLTPYQAPAIQVGVWSDPSVFAVTLLVQGTTPGAVVGTYVSPSRLAQGVTIPGIQGTLLLSSYSPVWFTQLGQRRDRWQVLPYPAYQTVVSAIRTPVYCQVLEFGPVPRLGSVTELRWY